MAKYAPDLQYFYEVSIDLLVVYKGLFENQSPKTAYIVTNTKDRIVQHNLVDCLIDIHLSG